MDDAELRELLVKANEKLGPHNNMADDGFVDPDLLRDKKTS